MELKDAATLAQLYQEFAAVDGLKVLMVAFKTHVYVSSFFPQSFILLVIFPQNRVKAIVNDVPNDESMVDALLDFKAFADSSLTQCFPAIKPPVQVTSASAPSTSAISTPAGPTPNSDFAYASRDAFTTAFKTRRIAPAEQIAKYIDRLMRRGQRGASNTDFEEALDAALRIYRFTDDKDIFRAFYVRALAKRLLLARTASDDDEKRILKKLREGTLALLLDCRGACKQQ